ncbi:MAG TPA: ABC transporter permease subunit, partial [Tepidisphaeraceae bacterium]|nr:ABC transporter permease subunit [Tepidisphaeraceae bacterium]
MSTSSSIDPRIPEPMIGFTGDIGGGAAGSQSIFAASDNRFGGDFIMATLARGSAVIVLLMLVALLAVLTDGAWPSIRQFGFHFVTSDRWQPERVETHLGADGNDVDVTVPGSFGSLAFIYGTVISSALALLFAVPLSLGAALFLVRIGPWLTPTFIKCGIFGLILTSVLVSCADIANPTIANWWRTIVVLGTFLGVGCTGFLVWFAWRNEDPRIGPLKSLQIFLHLGLGILVLSLLWLEGVSLGWSVVWAVAAAYWLGELGRAGVNILSFLIEFLAAIPSIAYGIWGLFVLVPFLSGHVEPPLNAFFGWVPFLRFLHTDAAPAGRDMLAAGLILAIMILPIITAISRDVLRAVPRIQIEGTQALGATWWQSSTAMLRYGRSGLFGAIMLGLARAAGETMAVTMVIGNLPQI